MAYAVLYALHLALILLFQQKRQVLEPIKMSDGHLNLKACHQGMAGYRITPVLIFWTKRELNWVKFTFETGFELPSSCVDLP
jgi:hypothetical protein